MSKTAVPDALATRNERVKLLASFINALCVGLIGFAVLRPITDGFDGMAFKSLWWGLAGLALHALSHYILGYI